MIKKLLSFIAAFAACTAFAAVDVNKADQAGLESIKGVGPSMSGKILEERKKGQFKDWNDLVERVQGVGEGNAAKFSAGGLTVNGTGFIAGAPAERGAKKGAKKEEQAAATRAAKPVDGKASGATVAKK